MVVSFFFFFQAEDGIRDLTVTGVQTCALPICENSVDLQVTCGGGILALRALEGAIETEGVQKRLYADLLAREIRITLGQLPAEFRETVRKVRVFGRGEFVQRFVNDVTPRVEPMGLRVELAR